MTIEKLWNDIQYIYDEFNFSSRLLIDDLMIVSKDNHYLLYYKQDDISTQIRIDKHYSLVNMWSDNKEVDTTYYNIHVEVGEVGENFSKVYTSENSMIELTYKIITPFLREVKLNKIGV
jgi:hypothetical protein